MNYINLKTLYCINRIIYADENRDPPHITSEHSERNKRIIHYIALLITEFSICSIETFISVTL